MLDTDICMWIKDVALLGWVDFKSVRVDKMWHRFHSSNLLVGGLLALNAALAALLRHVASCAAAIDFEGVSDPGAKGVGGKAALPMVPNGVGRFAAPTGVSRSAAPRGVSEEAW